MADLPRMESRQVVYHELVSFPPATPHHSHAIMIGNSPSTRSWLSRMLFATTIATVFTPTVLQVRAETLAFSTTNPEIEMWFYPISSANGVGSVRERGSTFSWYSPIEGFPDITGTGHDPIQRGTILVATNTSQTIPLLTDTSRYQINSVKVTLTAMNSIGSGIGIHDNTPDDYLAVAAGNDSDPGNPIEMWGVGFNGTYETFGFNGETEPEYFNSKDRRWPVSGGAISGNYQLFAADPLGNDISNAITGGYSATAPGNVTMAFSPTPYAVGEIYDTNGQPVPAGTTYGAGTTFTFEPDLNDANIVAYLQNSLGAGHLAFMFASLHQPNGHSGDIFYPDFYLNNSPEYPVLGAGPSIEIDVTILNETIPGDYNADGHVDTDDYSAWSSTFGSTVTSSSGADGNGDGYINAADYVLWRKHATSNTGFGSSTTVPEPQFALSLFAATWIGLFHFRLRRRLTARRS